MAYENQVEYTDKQMIPPSQVESAFHSLCAEVENLGQQLSFLEDRLSPICTPQSPTGEAKSGQIAAAAPVTSSHVSDLQNAARKVGIYGQRVSRLLSLLEV
jgi:hypothetical protein